MTNVFIYFILCIYEYNGKNHLFIYNDWNWKYWFNIKQSGKQWNGRRTVEGSQIGKNQGWRYTFWHFHLIVLFFYFFGTLTKQHITMHDHTAIFFFFLDITLAIRNCWCRRPNIRFFLILYEISCGCLMALDGLNIYLLLIQVFWGNHFYFYARKCVFIRLCIPCAPHTNCSQIKMYLCVLLVRACV